MKGKSFRWRWVFALGVLVLFLWPVAAAVRFFHLGSDTAALRESVTIAVKGDLDKTITIRVGWFATGLARMCSRAVKLEREPRAMLNSLRGAEVGVYKLREKPRRSDHAAILLRADRQMSARGWERIVGVSEDNQLVAAYFPKHAGSGGTLKCCVMVLDGCDLVVASARANLEPVVDILKEKIPLRDVSRAGLF